MLTLHNFLIGYVTKAVPHDLLLVPKLGSLITKHTFPLCPIQPVRHPGSCWWPSAGLAAGTNFVQDITSLQIYKFKFDLQPGLTVHFAGEHQPYRKHA